MEENNESNETQKRQISKFVIITVLMLIWVFGIGSITTAIIEKIEYDNAPAKTGLCGMHYSEIEGFNWTFLPYEGVQSGAQVKALLQRLIANADTFKEEPLKIPCISYNTSTSENTDDKNYLINKYAYAVVNVGETATYVDFINRIKDGLDLKHRYNVVIESNWDGLVSGITINYDKSDNFSNFVIAKNKDENIINGLKGIPELVDGEIKISSVSTNNIEK